MRYLILALLLTGCVHNDLRDKWKRMAYSGQISLSEYHDLLRMQADLEQLKETKP